MYLALHQVGTGVYLETLYYKKQLYAIESCLCSFQRAKFALYASISDEWVDALIADMLYIIISEVVWVIHDRHPELTFAQHNTIWRIARSHNINTSQRGIKLTGKPHKVEKGIKWSHIVSRPSLQCDLQPLAPVSEIFFITSLLKFTVVATISLSHDISMAPLSEYWWVYSFWARSAALSTTAPQLTVWMANASFCIILTAPSSTDVFSS